MAFSIASVISLSSMIRILNCSSAKGAPRGAADLAERPPQCIIAELGVRLVPTTELEYEAGGGRYGMIQLGNQFFVTLRPGPEGHIATLQGFLDGTFDP